MQPADKYFAKWYEANGSDYTWSKSLMEADGHVWALGWDTRLTVSWYRADMIQAVGAAVPRDLIEVGTAAGKIRAANPNVEGYLWPLSTKGDAAGVVEQLIPFIRSEGGNLIDAQGKAVFNSPAGVKVMSYARDLVAKYKGMSIAAVSMSPDDLLSGVKAGTVAMTSEQSARVSGARSAAGVGDNLKTSLVPSFTPSKPSPANIAGQICAIGANSKNPDQAWEFVQFMSAPDSQLLLARAGILAVRKQVFSDPMYQTPAGKEIGLWRDYIATESSMFFPPADFSKLSEILANAAQKVVSDTGIDVKAVLDAAAKEYDQYHAQFSK